MARRRANKRGKFRVKRRGGKRTSRTSRRTVRAVSNRVSQLARRFNRESKRFIDTWNDGILLVDNDIKITKLVPDIAKGDGMTDRDGDEISLRYIHIKGNVKADSSTTLNGTYGPYKTTMFIVQWNNPFAGTTLTGKDQLWEDKSGFALNLQHWRRKPVDNFKIIFKRTFVGGPYSNSTHGVNIDFEVKVPLHNRTVRFEGIETVSPSDVVQQGQLYIIFRHERAYNGTSFAPQMSYHLNRRLYYDA